MESVRFILLVFFCCLLCVCNKGIVQSRENIAIPDISIMPNEISKMPDPDKIYFFSHVNDADLLQISGNKFIKFLSLDYSNFSDLTPVLKLSNLEELKIYFNNNLKDISPLASLSNLRALELYGCENIDIESIAYLTNLKQLTLECNKDTDYRGLENLEQLERLRLSNSNRDSVIDLISLSKLVSLKELVLVFRVKTIKNISLLSNLTNLKYIEIHHTLDVRILVHLPKLESVSFGYNEDIDILPLAQSKSLKTIFYGVNHYYAGDKGYEAFAENGIELFPYSDR